MKSLKLSIIIVSWNTVKLTKNCLSSLSRQNFQMAFEIIVVDNASSDGSPDIIAKEFPEVVLIRNDKNVGFSKANNQAFEITNGEYILLLNSDTLIPDIKVLKDWTDFMDQNNSVGASGCKLLYPNGKHQVGDAGFKPSLSTIINYSFFLSKILPKYFNGIFINGIITQPLSVDWVSGAAFMVKKEILKTTGLLDESLFMFAEDIEWGCRIKSHGYKIFYLPKIEIIHYQGASTKKQKDKKTFSFLWLENLRLIYYMFNKNKPLILYDFIMSVSFMLRVVLYLFKYLITQNKESKIKLHLMSACLQYSLTNFCKTYEINNTGR